MSFKKGDVVIKIDSNNKLNINRIILCTTDSYIDTYNIFEGRCLITGKVADDWLTDRFTKINISNNIFKLISI